MRESACIQCGAIVTVESTRGMIPRRCPEHTKAHNRAVHLEAIMRWNARRSSEAKEATFQKQVERARQALGNDEVGA